MSSVVRFVTSLHVAPAVTGVTVALGLCAAGKPAQTCALAAGAGLLASGVVFLMAPIRTLRSGAKTHHVGIRELPGDATSGIPPITVFYPTDTAPRGSIAYLPFDDSRYSQGIASYAHVPSWFLRDLSWNRVRATLNAEPLPARGTVSPPMVLFSHGLGAYSRLQTRLHLELASQGTIVVAMTHTDHSAAFCRDPDGAIAVQFDTGAENTPDDREPMLAIRVKETLAALLRIQSGRLLRDLGYEDFTVRAWLTNGINVTLAGHSFGGATALAAAQESYATAGERTPITNVVVFDPWHIPLQRELFWGPLERGEKPYLFPTLQYFSSQWDRDTESRTFFQKLNVALEKQDALTPEVRGRLMKTGGRASKCQQWNVIRHLARVDHTHLTDTSLLLPIHKKWYATRGGTSVITEYATGLLEFAAQYREARVSFEA